MALSGTLALLSVMLSWDVLRQPDVVFAFNDGSIESELTPETSYPAALTHRWDNQFFFGIASGVAPLNSDSVLKALLGPHQFRRWGVVLCMVWTGLAGAWASRQFGRSPAASVLAGLLFAFCGWTVTFAVSGLTARSFAFAWALLSAGMLERGRRTGDWPSMLLAGGFLGLAVSDTADVGMLLAFALSGYYLLAGLLARKNRTPARLASHGARFIGFAAVAILVAIQMLQIMKGTSLGDSAPPASASAEAPDARYDWATQWSLPKAETWSLMASDYHGASNRSQSSPYWGRIGRSPGWEETQTGFRNFRLSGYAMGAVPFLLILGVASLLVRPPTRDLLTGEDRRLLLVLAILAGLCLMLAWGRYFPLYRVFFSLPMMSSIRNPDKWLGGFVLFTGLGFALAVDVVLGLARRDAPSRKKALRAVVAGMAILPLLGGAGLLSLQAGRLAFTRRLAADGYTEAVSSLAWQNALSANLQLVIVSLAAMGAVGWFLTRPTGGESQVRRREHILGGVLGTLMTVELLRAGLPYVMPYAYRHLLKDNVLTTYLDTHRLEGSTKLLPPGHSLLNHWRLTYLRTRGFDLYDPVSIRSMPARYQQLVETLQEAPLRLWQLGGVRFFLCLPEVAQQLEQAGFVSRLRFGAVQRGTNVVPSTQVPEEQKRLHLLEFPAAVPPAFCSPAWTVFPKTPEADKTVLSRLRDPAFDPLRETLVQTASAIPSSSGVPGSVTTVRRSALEGLFEIETSRDELLVRTVFFHPDWRVTIDGDPAPLLRTNFLLQGVVVPAGKHQVHFSFRPSQTPLVIAVAGRLLLLGGVVLWSIRDRRPEVL